MPTAQCRENDTICKKLVLPWLLFGVNDSLTTWAVSR